MSDELYAAVGDLEMAAKVLEAQADDGDFTVFVDGMEYIIERQNITGIVDCTPGMTRVSILCGQSNHLLQYLSIKSVYTVL